MPRFSGTFCSRIDAKGRVSIPAPYRVALDRDSEERRTVYLRRNDRNGTLEGFSEAFMDEVARRIDALPLNSEERDAQETAYFGRSESLKLDSEGRITLPESLARFAGLDRQATFMGLNSRFEIWNPERHAEAEAARIERAAKSTLPAPGGAQ